MPRQLSLFHSRFQSLSAQIPQFLHSGSQDRGSNQHLLLQIKLSTAVIPWHIFICAHCLLRYSTRTWPKISRWSTTRSRFRRHLNWDESESAGGCWLCPNRAYRWREEEIRQIRSWQLTLQVSIDMGNLSKVYRQWRRPILPRRYAGNGYND